MRPVAVVKKCSRKLSVVTEWKPVALHEEGGGRGVSDGADARKRRLAAAAQKYAFPANCPRSKHHTHAQTGRTWRQTYSEGDIWATKLLRECSRPNISRSSSSFELVFRVLCHSREYRHRPVRAKM